MAGAGGVKVEIAFDDGALDTSPTFTDVTAIEDNLVAGYDIHRGREFELDFTDSGTYTVTVKDKNGVLDPTNSSGALYGLIEPDLQMRVSLWNPFANEWQTRCQVWIDDYDYDLDPSQKMATLKITGYDIFALLTGVEMQPGEFGDPPPGAIAGGRDGAIFFDNATFKDRIDQVGTNALGATAWAFWAVVFSGNVNLYESTHSAGENPMDVVQRALDGEFPGVSNAYPDRFGRLAAHGRLAKFDPHGTWLSIAGSDVARDAVWRFRQWKLGDGAAVVADSDNVQIRPPFSWNRGRSKIINSALAYPIGIKDADIAGQYVKDLTSIGLRGYKSWSKENLLTESGILTGNDANAETKAFAQFYVNNYAQPRNRVTALTVKTVRPDDPRAEKVWQFLGEHDIADTVALTVTNPGGGGFNLEPFYIEGTSETVEPAGGEFAIVTTSIDVSPAAYFTGDLAGLDGS